MNSASGYGAARQLHAGRLREGWRAAGRKIGFTNRTIWPRYGVYEPIWGMVYDRTLIEASSDRARVPLEGLANPRIEPEICFGLKSAPAQSKDPEAMLAAIDWIAHSIEIVQCPHPQWKTTLEEAQAQNGLHGRLVVGTRQRVDTMPGLAALLPLLRVVLSRGDVEVDSGVGANVLDSPLLALAHLVEVLAQQPASPPLAAGDLISTGTLTDAHPVQPGETWCTAFAGLPLGGLTVSFE